jgi:hypothetical protein
MHALLEQGWRVCRVTDAADTVAAAALTDFALILLAADLPMIGTMRVVDRLGRDPDRATPILILADAAGLPSGDRLNELATDPAVPVPRSPGPMARFATLYGEAAVVRLFRRFRDRIAAILDAADPFAIGEGATPIELAHRMTGIAGTLDFAALSIAWAMVDQAGPAALADAWAETRIARAMLDRMLAGAD